MKRSHVACAIVMPVIAAAIVYFYGISLHTGIIVALLLLCPVWVIWQGLRMSKQTERDINAAVSQSKRNSR